MLKVTWKEFGVIVLLLAVMAAVLLLPMLARSREASRRSSCSNNLKQMGIMLMMFSNEAKSGAFPAVSPIANNWIMDMNTLYPEYTMDLSIFICPSSPFQSNDTFRLQHAMEHPGAEVGGLHPDCVTSLFYNYTGYMILSDEQALALYEAYLALPPEVFGYNDIKTPIPEGKHSAAAQSGVPVVWDRVPPTENEFSHRPLGGNILFMDGHVEFIRYSHYNTSNNFPMTSLAGQTFGSATPQVSQDCYKRAGRIPVAQYGSTHSQIVAAEDAPPVGPSSTNQQLSLITELGTREEPTPPASL